MQILYVYYMPEAFEVISLKDYFKKPTTNLQLEEQIWMNSSKPGIYQHELSIFQEWTPRGLQVTSCLLLVHKVFISNNSETLPEILFCLSLFAKANFDQWFNSLVSYINKVTLVTTQCSYNRSDLSFRHNQSWKQATSSSNPPTLAQLSTVHYQTSVSSFFFF